MVFTKAWKEVIFLVVNGANHKVLLTDNYFPPKNFKIKAEF